MHQPDKTDSTGEQCFTCAVKFLNIRDHSIYELEFKLRKKGFDENSISQAVKKCIDYNYLDDERFALRYFETLKDRLNGPRKIISELYKKKISTEIIEKLIKDYQSSGEEYSIAKRYFLKIRYKIEKKNINKRNDAFFRSMASRGFSKEIIFDILNEFPDLFKKDFYY